MTKLLCVFGLLILLSQPVSADDTARVSYYGLGDGYLGAYHSAFWHGETPAGWPDTVDLVHPGIATSNYLIPLGAVLCFRVVSFPDWAQDEYTSLVSNVACGIVVDRMAPFVHGVYGESYDVWPLLAERLMGNDFRRIGIVQVKIAKGEMNEQEAMADQRGSR